MIKELVTKSTRQNILLGLEPVKYSDDPVVWRHHYAADHILLWRAVVAADNAVEQLDDIQIRQALVRVLLAVNRLAFRAGIDLKVDELQKAVDDSNVDAAVRIQGHSPLTRYKTASADMTGLLRVTIAPMADETDLEQILADIYHIYMSIYWTSIQLEYNLHADVDAVLATDLTMFDLTPTEASYTTEFYQNRGVGTTFRMVDFSGPGLVPARYYVHYVVVPPTNGVAEDGTRYDKDQVVPSAMTVELKLD